MHSLGTTWQGFPLIPTSAALQELYREGMDLEEVKQVLDQGVPSGRRRKKGIYEFVLRRKDRSQKVVVAEGYNYSLRTFCWVVLHVGSVRV